MPAYCVAANCNNSQTTPGITMHEFGQSISFVFGARLGHFAATPQSDVVGIWSRDLGVMATLSIRQKIPFSVHL